MDCTFEEYIMDIKSQLLCNVFEKEKEDYIVFDLSEEQIDNNESYFEDSWKRGISGYKALTFLELNNILNKEK